MIFTGELRPAPCTLLELSGDPKNLLRLVQTGDDLLLKGLAGGAPRDCDLEIRLPGPHLR